VPHCHICTTNNPDWRGEGQMLKTDFFAV